MNTTAETSEETRRQSENCGMLVEGEDISFTKSQTAEVYGLHGSFDFSIDITM